MNMSERFKSKSGFIFASIGAAVGLGNALRFPGLCAKYGGGSFLLVYFVALVVLGLPLLNAEIALGRAFKGGAPACLAGLSRRKRAGASAGWASAVNSVLTAVIYAGLAGWIICTAVTVVPLCVRAPELSRNEISDYFFDGVLSARPDGVIDGLSLPVLGCIAAAWVAMFFCLRGGAGTLAKAARFTVIIPVVLLALMAGRGLIYENSGQALSALFIPDLSALKAPDLWITALGQVFFSLSVAVGVMPVYGSYLPARTNIFTCSLVIVAADFLVSVLASAALFTTLYGCGIEDKIGESGIITAFAVYPVAITRLFGDNAALNAVAGALFYSSLAMMSVQSAVSMLEAFLSPYAEETGKNKKTLALKACVIGGVCSVIFATTAAPLAVEISDKFVNFYNVLALCLIESLLIARSGKTADICDEVNKFAPLLRGKRVAVSLKPFVFSVKFLAPSTLVAFCAAQAVTLVASPPTYPQMHALVFGAALSLAVAVCAVALGLRGNNRYSHSSACASACLGNGEERRCLGHRSRE